MSNTAHIRFTEISEYISEVFQDPEASQNGSYTDVECCVFYSLRILKLEDFLKKFFDEFFVLPEP